jgi:AraC-type DNA-binding domain-containing proteins
LAEGTNYRQLKDELRRDIAIELFSSSSLTVAEVAARTGFQETSAFHRDLQEVDRGQSGNVPSWQGEFLTVRTRSVVITLFMRSEVLARLNGRKISFSSPNHVSRERSFD